MREFKDLKIAVAGTGYVGLSIATLLSQHHHVTAVDIIPEKVELINNKKSPIQDDYIEKYLAEKELNLTATLDTSDITFDYTNGNNEIIVHNKHTEPWKVTVVDTGLNTQTGGRVKRIREYIGNEPFMLTYGDAVGDVNITELVAFHKAHGKLGTMSMYNFGQNKGVVEVGANGVIDAFREKSDMDGDLINIGFMVFQPELFDLIEGDNTVFEKGPLTKLVEQRELVGYVHRGYWQCMDTLREKQKLESLWESGNAPWKVWEG